jgi:uncharacterized protein YpmS
VSSIKVPDWVTVEMVRDALRALSLDHLENDTEQGIAIREVHITNDGVEVVMFRMGPPFGVDASTVVARIGRKDELA